MHKCSDVGVKIKVCVSQQQPSVLKRAYNDNFNGAHIMTLNKYSKWYGLQNVTGLPKISMSF